MAKSGLVRGATSLFVLSSAFACSSLIGIENPSDAGTGGEGGEKPSSGGKVGSSGGESSSSGGTASGGKAEGPSGGSASGGATNGTGGALGGEGPTGGSTGGSSSGPQTVKGRIVDLFGRPVVSVEVRITDADPVLTDDQGKFSVDAVTAPYDVDFSFKTRDGYYERFYRYVGLTRPDPLLQVSRDVGESYALLTVAMSNLPGATTGSLVTSLGDPVGYEYIGDQEGFKDANFDYDGKDPFSVPFHALYWKNDFGTSEFYGHAARSAPLNNGSTTNVALDAWDPITSTGHIVGHIVAEGADPTVQVRPYVDFPDGASVGLEILPWVAADQSYSVLVPDLGLNETLTVAARVDDASGGYAVGHASGIAIDASSKGVDLTVPTVPLLQSPHDEALDADQNTIFRWTPASQSPCSLFVVRNDAAHREVNIVTCDKKAQLPLDVLNGFFAAGEDIWWTVQAHGAFQSTDEMAGAAGFHDSFSASYGVSGYPRGKNRPTKGTFAEATFWMATLK